VEEWTWGAVEHGSQAPDQTVPDTIQAVLATRIDRLPPADKRLLQTAAVMGIDVSVSLLQAVTALPEAALHDSLGRLQAAEFLFETRAVPDLTYTFKHALTQEVAYHSLLTSTRQQVHQRIAQVVEAQFFAIAETQPELVAHHYTEAGSTAQAIAYWQRAGQQALQRSANPEAVRHLTKGLALLAMLPQTSAQAQQELDLQLALGQTLSTTKGYAAP